MPKMFKLAYLAKFLNKETLRVNTPFKIKRCSETFLLRPNGMLPNTCILYPVAENRLKLRQLF